MTWWEQAPYGVRFDWGPEGARRASAKCLVVVDVLSFTTAVTVAAERGIRVYPHPPEDAEEFAKEHQAELAVGRRETTEDRPWSLSPAGLRKAPPVPRLVLPSPNGSAISQASQVPVIAASLRNATAAGRWLTKHGYGTPERPVVVIAAGERWPDGSLRPALEDLLGAGAVLAALPTSDFSPEASAAISAFLLTDDVRKVVTESASARELTAEGFAADVEVAVEVEATNVVPVLREGAFAAD
jgi:2-phosphosulfolactate phosphatase